MKKMPKIIDMVLKEGKDEFIKNVYHRFVEKTDACGVLYSGNLFDLLMAYHDGNTSVAVSEMTEECEAINTMYYDNFYIIRSMDGSLSLALENTLRILQPSFLLHKTTVVSKITVVENVKVESPGITIILESSTGPKYGIAMRTTNLIINKNMEVK